MFLFVYVEMHKEVRAATCSFFFFVCGKAADTPDAVSGIIVCCACSNLFCGCFALLFDIVVVGRCARACVFSCIVYAFAGFLFVFFTLQSEEMRLTLVLAVVILLACVAAVCQFGVVDGYPGYGGKLNGTQKKWMSRLNDSKRLFLDLTIPGTHESGTYVSEERFYQYKVVTVKEQLEAGVRFLDIRLAVVDGDICVVPVVASLIRRLVLFRSILQDVAKFLRENSGEVVIMRLKRHLKEGVEPIWQQQIVDEVLRKFNASRDFACQHVDCAIGPSRGKIIFLEDGLVAPGFHFLNYTEVLGIQQNDYILKFRWDLWDKWKKARNLMIYVSTTERTTGVINFFSGGGGAFPYFVASGQSDPYSGLSLWTGVSKACWDDPWGVYPDFPRKNCAFCGEATVCSIHFHGTNNMLYDWLRNGRLGEPQSREVPYVWPRRLGILVLDFPDNAVIDEMIEVNFMNSSPFKGEEYISSECMAKCPSCIAGDTEITTEGRGIVAARDVAVGDRVPGLWESEWCDVVAAVRVSENGTVFGNFTSDHLVVVRAARVPNSSPSYVIRPSGAAAPARNVDLVNIATTCPVVRTVGDELFTPLSTSFCPNLTWRQYVPLHAALMRIVAKTGTFWFDPSQFFAGDSTPPWNDTGRLLSSGSKAGWWDNLPGICSAMAACAADGQRCDEFERMCAGWMLQHVPQAKYALIARVYPNLGNPAAQHGRLLEDVRRPRD